MTSIDAAPPSYENEARMSSYVKQATSSQDIAFHGTSSDGSFNYICVSDSHGTNLHGHKYQMIDILKSIDWSTELLNDDWTKTLVEKTGQHSNGTGATFTLFKIFPEHFECYYIGDSSGKIYELGDEADEPSCIWQTKDHDYDNLEEIERLKSRAIRMVQAWDIGAFTPKMLRSKQSKVFHFNYINAINMPRSLGHNGLTYEGLAEPLDFAVIPRDASKKYKIIAGTDGCWQILCPDDISVITKSDFNAEKLSMFAYERWTQKWDWDNTFGDIEKDMSLPLSNIDDIGVAIWTNV